jgi:AraC family transcriptional regulator
MHEFARKDMLPEIINLTSKKLIGMHLDMCLAENKTAALWQRFMPRRKEIVRAVGNDLYALQVYPASFDFKIFSPIEVFEKWATVEVSDYEVIPHGMEAYPLIGGLYAVFHYKGLSTDTDIFQYIYGEWLPQSTVYVLDNRPHFEVLGEKYKNNDSDSEEDIWIPIKEIMK